MKFSISSQREREVYFASLMKYMPLPDRLARGGGRFIVAAVVKMVVGPCQQGSPPRRLIEVEEVLQELPNLRKRGFQGEFQRPGEREEKNHRDILGAAKDSFFDDPVF